MKPVGNAAHSTAVGEFEQFMTLLSSAKQDRDMLSLGMASNLEKDIGPDRRKS